MCLLAAEAHLSDTRIFAGVCANGRQAVIYENKVKIPKSFFDAFTKKHANFMCLPVPLQDGLDPKEHISLYSFSSEGKSPEMKKLYEKFFTTLGGFFYNPNATLSISRSANSAQPKTLEVFQVGGYKCSLARTPNDVLNLDPEVFGKPTGLHTLLNHNYAKDFAFLCCSFEPKDTEFHPILYTHPLSSDGKLFIPTRHFHGSGDPDAKVAKDWDHQVYVFGGDKQSLSSVVPSSLGGEKGVLGMTMGDTFTKALKDVEKPINDAFASTGRDSIVLNTDACQVKIVGSFANIDLTPTVAA